ncbi:MAG: hypothetical protein IT233_11910 [Bacteroidia bacterium]|nr:hypothetical protein [Bacteroidia bacterium]
MTRLLDHPFNFTAIGAMALFGGAAFSDRRMALAVPVLAMFVTDLILGFHNTMVYVYASFIAIALIGMIISRRRSFGAIAAGTLTSSALFFLVTNFGVWMNGGLYTPDFSGLVECYIAGLAFYDHSFFGNLGLNTLMGDIFFNGILFGALALAERKFPALAKVRS